MNYGEFGLQAQEPCWITSNQIEAARIAMTRYTRRGGQVWIKIFPDKPVTQKPAETRMGSGKGSPEYWVAVVKPGRVLFEIAGVSEETAREGPSALPATSCPARRRSSARRIPRTVVNEMKANEIRSMSETELELKLADLKKDLFMLRMQHATNHLDTPTKISATRRDHRPREDRHPREAARALRR